MIARRGLTMFSMAIILLLGNFTADAQLGMRSSSSKEALKNAQDAIQKQAWPEAMDHILTLLTIKPTDKTALTMLRTVGPEFFRGQQSKIEAAQKNGNAVDARDQCALTSQIQQRLDGLNLKTKKKDEPFPSAPKELLDMCESQARTTAEIRLIRFLRTFKLKTVDMLTYPKVMKRLWKEVKHVHKFVIPWVWDSGL